MLSLTDVMPVLPKVREIIFYTNSDKPYVDVGILGNKVSSVRTRQAVLGYDSHRGQRCGTGVPYLLLGKLRRKRGPTDVYVVVSSPLLP